MAKARLGLSSGSTEPHRAAGLAAGRELKATGSVVPPQGLGAGAVTGTKGEARRSLQGCWRTSSPHLARPPGFPSAAPPSPWAVLSSLLSHLLDGGAGLGGEEVSILVLAPWGAAGPGRRLWGQTPGFGELLLAPRGGSRLLIHPVLGS